MTRPTAAEVLVVGSPRNPIASAVVDEFAREGIMSSLVEPGVGRETRAELERSEGLRPRILVYLVDEPEDGENLGPYLARTVGTAADLVDVVFGGLDAPDSGAVVLVGLPLGTETSAGLEAVASTAGALRGISRAWVVELGDRGVRSNFIQPGVISTDRWPGADAVPAHAPLTRGTSTLGTPDDVAKAVVFLASDDAAYITGAELDVDGGMSQCRSSLFSALWAEGTLTAHDNPLARGLATP